MKLFDILEVFNETGKVNVWDNVERDNLLTFYDETFRIDMIYNYCEVSGVSTHYCEYDEISVLDIYIKQDDKEICRGEIADYIRNEFEHSEDEIKEETSKSIIDLAVSYHDNQASYDINSQVLILDCGEIVRYIPVSYEDINSYLDFGLLCAMLDNLQAVLD